MKKKTVKQDSTRKPGNKGSSAPDPAQNCDYFIKRGCGGCSFLHIPYADQLIAKQDQIVSILKATFSLLPAAIRPKVRDLVQPMVPSPKPMGYRASAKFYLHEDRSGKNLVGLYKQGSRVVVDTTGCPANVDWANELQRVMFLNKSLIPAKFANHGDGSFQKNRLKFLTVRSSPSSGNGSEAGAVVISHTGVDRQAMSKWLLDSGLGGLCVYESRLSKADGDNITGRKVEHLCGPETFTYALDGQVFNISPASFFQANHSLAADLIINATNFTGDGDILLDLYGGFGAYSFALTKRFSEIQVVDGNKAAISAANAHAKQVGVPHLKAFADTCENFLEKKLAQETAGKITHIIVNPSRTGMTARVLTAIAPAVLPQLQELHYISCNPSTFARDAKSLVGQGYTLTSVLPFDMFPQTEHVELVAKFSVRR